MRSVGVRGRAAVVVSLLTAVGVQPVRAEPFDTTNDFGNVGLIQTPTARFADEGEFGAGYSIVKPYHQGQIFATPLPWLETGFRYTDVTNIPYGPQSFSGSQSYKDRSFTLKLRLLQEGEAWPSLALGIQDLGGTGVFGGEYLVASRRYYDFDFSLGLGWGRLGAGGRIHNPLGVLSDHFDHDRQQVDNSNSTPGGSGFGRLFTGRTVGFFGGVQWRTPVPGVSMQVEYDGNDYKHEGLGDNQPQSSPVNVGLDYEPFSGIHFGVAYERGDLLTARISLRTNFVKFTGVPKFADPPPPEIRSREPGPVPTATTDAAAPDVPASQQQAAVDQLKAALAQQHFDLIAVNFIPEKREIEVWLGQDRYRSPAKIIGRTAAVLTQVAPDEVERFTVINEDAGVETFRVTVLRHDFERLANNTVSPEELLIDSELAAPHSGDPQATFAGLSSYPKYGYDMGPGVKQQIGGPDGFYFGALTWRVSGHVDFTPHLKIASSLSFNIIDNFDGLKQPSNSELPHVRSDIVQYLRQGKNSLSKLDANYIWSPFSQWYARASAGIFEDMYGGIGGQLLWRPYQRRYAIGLDLAYLKQRGFNERFDFRNYSIATGFLDFYYDLPFYDLVGKLSIGRYLAGDRGATIDLARRFQSGVLVGAFATFTNVSSAQFGEGSFDKGLYIAIPFDIFFARSSRTVGTLVFRPLTRDGGQRARDGVDLYSVVGNTSEGMIRDHWPDVEH